MLSIARGCPFPQHISNRPSSVQSLNRISIILRSLTQKPNLIPVTCHASKQTQQHFGPSVCQHPVLSSSFSVQPNFFKFNKHDVKKEALHIFSKAIEAVKADRAIRKVLHLDSTDEKMSMKIRMNHDSLLSFDLNNDYKQLIVIGFGKASASMAQTVEKILADTITSGHVITKYGHAEGLSLKHISITEGGHPIPDQKCVNGTDSILKLFNTLSKEEKKKTLVLCLVSGGGSALLCSPVQGIALEDLKKTNKLLLDCGANINEINTIRKHLSCVKGGMLARHIYPAKVVSLILSDVIGDPLNIIASGPTVPDDDESTFKKCLDIINKYRLKDALPICVWEQLNMGISDITMETPKNSSDAHFFTNCENIIISNNKIALHNAEKEAKLLGYNTLLLSTRVDGEAREVAKVWSAIAKSLLFDDCPIKRPACILIGGETTVTITGNGKGGRSQEMALAALIALGKDRIDAEVQKDDKPNWDNVAILCGGTDGTDGPVDAAGAVIDGNTFKYAKSLKLNPMTFLSRNDSYSFFSHLGEPYHIITGPTQTNVMDINIIIVR